MGPSFSETSLENGLTHLLLTTTVSSSSLSFSFTTSAFLLFFLFLWVLPSFVHAFHILLTNCLRNVLHAWPLYSLTMSPSSFGNAPLSCNIFSLTTLHRPFCTMNPPVSNSFHGLLYSFFVILLFCPSIFQFLASLAGILPSQGPEFVSTFCRALSCSLPPACSSSSILVPFSVSHSPSIFCTNPKCCFRHCPKFFDK